MNYYKLFSARTSTSGSLPSLEVSIEFSKFLSMKYSPQVFRDLLCPFLVSCLTHFFPRKSGDSYVNMSHPFVAYAKR